MSTQRERLTLEREKSARLLQLVADLESQAARDVESIRLWQSNHRAMVERSESAEDALVELRATVTKKDSLTEKVVSSLQFIATDENLTADHLRGLAAGVLVALDLGIRDPRRGS